MKLFDVNSNTYIHPNKEINDKDPTFKTGDTVRISIYKNIFAKDHVPNWSEVLLLQKLKILSCGQVVSDLKSEKIVGTFYEKELQKINQREFRIEKVIKRKGDKLYVKWKT